LIWGRTLGPFSGWSYFDHWIFDFLEFTFWGHFNFGFNASYLTRKKAVARAAKEIKNDPDIHDSKFAGERQGNG